MRCQISWKALEKKRKAFTAKVAKDATANKPLALAELFVLTCPARHCRHTGSSFLFPVACGLWPVTYSYRLSPVSQALQKIALREKLLSL